MTKRIARIGLKQVYIQFVEVEYDDKTETLDDVVRRAENGEGDDVGEIEYSYTLEDQNHYDVYTRETTANPNDPHAEKYHEWWDSDLHSLNCENCTKNDDDDESFNEDGMPKILEGM